MDSVTMAALDDAALQQKMYDTMAARAVAEQGFKAEQKAIQDELERRVIAAKLDDVLGGLSDDQRAAVLAAAAKGG